MSFGLPAGVDPAKIGKRTPSQIGKGSAAKGAKGERDVLGEFRAVMQSVEQELSASGLVFVARSDFATRKRLSKGTSNRDLGNIPLISIEVKRNENLNLKAAWEQACRQADQGELPVLVYRYNREAWRVRSYIALTGPAGNVLHYAVGEVALPDFLSYYQAMYRAFLVHTIGG